MVANPFLYYNDFIKFTVGLTSCNSDTLTSVFKKSLAMYTFATTVNTAVVVHPNPTSHTLNNTAILISIVWFLS